MGKSPRLLAWLPDLPGKTRRVMLVQHPAAGQRALHKAVCGIAEAIAVAVEVPGEGVGSIALVVFAIAVVVDQVADLQGPRRHRTVPIVAVTVIGRTARGLGAGSD